MPKPIYRLSDPEKKIIEMSWKDARYFSAYFLNGWIFDDKIDHPWQLEAHHAEQGELTVVGGFGAGKTVPFGVSYLIRAATVPYYKFMNVADVAYQSRQMFDSLRLVLMNTRMMISGGMVWKIIEKPYPKIVIKNSYVGESTLEFMSADKNGEKILSWEGDAVHIDEAGRIQDLEDLVRNLGTRLRGTVRHPDLWDPTLIINREREARLSMTSNAWENPYMWWRLDMAKVDPSEYWARVLSTYDNHNLTDRQIKKFEGKITTDEDRARWLLGARPKGIGDQYSAEMIDKCMDEGLIPMVEDNVKKGVPGFSISRAEKVGIYHLEMPPEVNNEPKIEGKARAADSRVYAVVGDPGQGNPPYRNAPCIIVFDITDFPKGPARLRAFWWGFGNGSYDPFVSQMKHYVEYYHATDACFDSTGTQKMMDELVFERDGFPVIGMNVAGLKHNFNTALKLFMDRALISFPDIPGLRAQLGNYKLPDTKIAQDIVAVLQMAAGYLRRYYYGPTQDSEEDDWEKFNPPGRYNRSVGRRFDRRTSR